MQTVKLTSGLYIDSRTIMGPNTQFNITLMIWKHENQTTAWKTTTTTSVCLFVCLVLTRTEPMSWPSSRCVETWHIGSLTVNTEPGHMLHAGASLQTANSVFICALTRAAFRAGSVARLTLSRHCLCSAKQELELTRENQYATGWLQMRLLSTFMKLQRTFNYGRASSISERRGAAELRDQRFP